MNDVLMFKFVIVGWVFNEPPMELAEDIDGDLWQQIDNLKDDIKELLESGNYPLIDKYIKIDSDIN